MELTRPISTQPDARVVVLGGMGDTLEPVVHGLSQRPGLTVIVVSTEADVADRLRARSAMPVEVVRGRTRLQPDRVFVLAPDVDLVVEKYDVVAASGNASTPPAEQPMTMRSRRGPSAGSTTTRSSRDAAMQR